MISQQPPIGPANQAVPLDRRSVISGLGLMGLGWLASSGSADAFAAQAPVNAGPRVIIQTQTRRPEPPQAQAPARAITLPDLPSDWARTQGVGLQEYARYLVSLNLKSISAQQVIEAHAKNKGSIWNTLPPKKWWKRMGYTLRVADRIALEMNVKEVEVVSAYRCPVYNAHCEGAKVGSWHQANVAVDVKFPTRPSKVAAVARNLRERGLFKGGVGGYWNFTHIDSRGINIDW
jgi:hypothetical protein